MIAMQSRRYQSLTLASFHTIGGDGDTKTQHAVAEFFGVSVSCVEKLLQRYCPTGEVPATPHGGGRQRRLDTAGDYLVLALIQQ